MSFSLGIGLGITMQDPNWWNAFREGGFNATLILSFKTGQYYNEHQKNIADLVTSATAGLRTTTLSDGNIGWGGHNLLTYSEDLSQALQTGGSSSTLVFTEDSSNGEHYTQLGVATNILDGQSITIEVEVEKNQDRIVLVNFGATRLFANFNTTTGVVTEVSSSAEFENEAAAITDLGDTFLLKLSGDRVSGTLSYVRVGPNNGTTGAAPSYLGDGVSEVHATKIRLYRSDLGGMQPNSDGSSYFPTTAAAYYAPAIQYDPVTLARRGVVVEGNDLTRINTSPVCNDGTGWSDSGSTTTNLSIDALGAFDGASVASGGSIGNKLQAIAPNRPTLVSGSVYPFTFLYDGSVATEATASGSVRLVLRDITGATETQIQGVVGSAAVNASNAGTISELTERLHSDGVTRILSGYFTPNFSTTMAAGIGPFSAISGKTVVALGFFIGAAGEKLPATPILGNDGSTATQLGDELSLDSVPSEIELVTNGGFDTGDLTGWVDTNSYWTVVSNAAHHASTADFNTLKTTGIPDVGRTMRLSFDVSGYSGSQGMRVQFRDIADSALSQIYGSVGVEPAVTANGSYSIDIVIPSSAHYIAFSRDVAGFAEEFTLDNVSAQELVPFVGFDGTQGTWVFKGNWVHESSIQARLISGDSNTRFIYQNSGNSNLQTYDGTTVISKSGFTDNTDTAVVMSYLEGGNFNILVDGGVEGAASLTGDLAIPSVDIGHLAGTNGMHGLIYEILWYPAQLDLATRQGISV